MNNKDTISEPDLPIERILVVDDEPSLRVLLSKALGRAGFVCTEAADAEKAWDLISSGEDTDLDLVITDIAMPGMDGIELLKKVKAYNPSIDFIIMTGYASEYSYVDIMDAGASDYMTKPFNIDSALARIKRIAREKRHLIDLEETNLQLRKAMERANRLAQEAKDASKAKTFFLATMSHEIRTPLNGIVGYTDMLMDTDLDKEQKTFLESARFSCDTLLSVVNDILDFSKVESGKLYLEEIAFDPEVLCFDTIDVVRTQVDESRVELLCRISDTVPGKVVGDPHRFRQVLLNLLGNAVKFTPKGSITLRLDADVEGSHTLLTVTVSDTGIGIATEKQSHIFEPFTQSEEDITNRYGGTGLGLAISRNIARKMDGDLRVKSTKGNGAEFYFTARLKTGEIVPRRQRIRPAGLSGKRVLVVSTGPDASEILAHILSTSGMEVDIRPLEQLPQVLSAPADKAAQDYDLGIFDFGKSVKPGARDIPDLMQGTSPGDFPFNWMACAVPFPGIAQIFDKGGFKGFISKPARQGVLLDMAAHIMGMSRQGAKDAAEKKQPAMLTTHSLSESKKMDAVILLVEDNPVNQKMAKLMLTRAGYQVEVAKHGKDALTAYVKAPDQYDLVLMDINMPEMDGFEATERIRSHEMENSLDPIPILALTANVLDDFKQRCKQTGMNDFLTKPIKREVVFAAIQKWVRKRG